MKRNFMILLLAMLNVGLCLGAVVHTSTFDSATGTNPVAAGDATFIWAVDGSWTGGAYGHYSYNGAGQLGLTHPNHDWDDPFMEFDIPSSTTLNLGDMMEITLDVTPGFTTTGYNQGLTLSLNDADADVGTTHDGDWAVDSDVFIRVTSTLGIVKVAFGDDSGNIGAQHTLSESADEITSMRLILSYNGNVDRFYAFYSVNGGNLYQFADSPIDTNWTKPVVRIEAEQWYTTGQVDAFTALLDNLTISDSVSVDTYYTPPLRISTFNYAAGSYPISVGDVDQYYAGGADDFDYNDLGQLVCTHGAATSGWPNSSINFSTTTDEDCFITIDIKPEFTAGGIGQMFNAKFGVGQTSAFVGNFAGTGLGWGVFWGQDDIFALETADADTDASVAAEDITDMRLKFTYNAATQEHRFFWSVNGGELQEHPNSPIVLARTATRVEFQWQVWSVTGYTNPDAFSVGLDHYIETATEDESPSNILNGAGFWTLY